MDERTVLGRGVVSTMQQWRGRTGIWKAEGGLRGMELELWVWRSSAQSPRQEWIAPCEKTYTKRRV